MEQLERILSRIDGRGYKAYKEIKGRYDFRDFVLFIDYVQGDPFAAPSRIRLRIPQQIASFNQELFKNKARRIALCDYLTREFAKNIPRLVRGRRGTGSSGEILIDRPGQEILERTSCVVNSDFVEARIGLGLPAAGRRILSREASAMFFDEIPRLVSSSLLSKNLDGQSLVAHIESCEDQEYLRGQLEEKGLVAFVANGSILPRASGIDDRPLKGKEVVPFRSPPELEVEIDLPNSPPISGMGIPEGVTLIVGGGYHGKTTLLSAIEKGVYNHILGDGREKAAAIFDAVKIRAEDGRRIEKVDISSFINNLPLGRGTVDFSTDNASGSTSQAANIMEALEMGVKLLLLDEDTSATNFMIRDKRMQELVAKEKEPITPFIDKVRLLHKDYGVGTCLVIGGSGDYFEVSDTVIMMDEYRPREVTSQAAKIASLHPTGRAKEGGGHFGRIKERVPLRSSFDPSKGNREVKISVQGRETILFGRWMIDLSSLEQLVDTSQTRFIAEAIYFLSKRYLDGKNLKEAIELFIQEIDRNSLDFLFSSQDQIRGDLALSRKYELAMAINRLRSLKIGR
ncbi:ABC-ATPase domain-containing protein [bacterium]|nr:ABC-ATPase domain-containing protein [bacterium]